MRYDDMIIEAFDVPAEANAGPGTSAFKVRVLSSRAGQHGMADALLRSFDKQQLQAQLNLLADRGLDTAGMIAYGRALANLLLTTDAPPNAASVRDLFSRSRTLAGQDGGVRLRLQLSPELARLPWEYMYIDPAGGGDQLDGFLALDPRVAIVRHETLSADVPTLEPPADETLKVMAAMALAADMAQLDLKTEQAMLERIFGAKGVVHQFIEQSTIEDILENIADAHVFHFSGHGIFESNALRPRTFTGTGELALADGRVDSEQLGLNLRGNSLRLAVLGACESGKRGGANVVNLWGSIAAMLIKTGVPAVVANQLKVADACAIAFSQAFYSGLFGGMSLERAVTAGRLAAYNADKAGRDWGVTVLYLRARDGQLFKGLADEDARRAAGAAAETLIQQRIEVIQSDGGAVLKDVHAGGDVNVLNKVSHDSVAQKFEAENIFLGGEEKPDLIPNPPPVPRHYVGRESTEQALRDLLLMDDDKSPVVLLWGSEGIGKGALARSVVNQLFDDKLFAGGVLWGNLASNPVDELLRDFLGALGPRWSEGHEHNLKAAQLWQVLDERQKLAGDENRRTLVVVDNVQEIDLLKQLSPSWPTRNRLLAISDGAFALDDRDIRGCGPVPPFESEHTLRLFANIFDQMYVDKYHDTLVEIGEFFHNMPNRLSSAARTLLENKLAPQIFLRQLQESEAQSGALGEALLQAQELVLQNLTPAQLDIFALASVFGRGGWSVDMMAAVALHPQQDLLKAIDMLARRDLLAASNGRYRLNVVFRELAQRRFAQRTAYEQAAARRLFAYACLQAVRDIEEELGWQLLTPSDVHGNPNERFYWEFRNRLTPEMSHIRSALDWAVQTESWEIIRRFAYLSYMGLVDYLIWNCGVTYLDLSMTTISVLAIRNHGDWQPARQRMSPNGVAGLSNSLGESKVTFDNSADEKKIMPLLKNASPNVAELYFSLMAGYVDDGAILGADLVHGSWIGVNTRSVVWWSVDMVGVRLLACDLSANVLRDCNATRGELQGTILSYAILRRVKLRGANLRDVDLTRTILDDVDLRDADLTGANLTGARLNRVNLLGARLDNVIWAGATYDKLVVGQRQQDDIDEAIRNQPAERFKHIYELPETRDLPNDEYPPTPARRKSELRIDRRAADLSKARFSGSRLRAADLRAAILAEARLENVDLREADLRAAWLVDALITKNSRLGRALLFAANMERLRVDDTDMKEASLYAASLRMALLNDVSLEAADLFAASMTKAILTAVDLRGARLGGASLDDARLYAVDLTGAYCSTGDDAKQQMDDLLKQAYRLRGTIMPDGTRYDGRYRLKGDLAEAQDAGIDVDDAEAMRQFYAQEERKRSFTELSILHLGVLVSDKNKSSADATVKNAEILAELAARNDTSPVDLLDYCDQLIVGVDPLNSEGPWMVYAQRLVRENSPGIVAACIRHGQELAAQDPARSDAAKSHAAQLIQNISGELTKAAEETNVSMLADWFSELAKATPEACTELAQLLNSTLFNRPFLVSPEASHMLWLVPMLAQMYLRFEEAGLVGAEKIAADSAAEQLFALLLSGAYQPAAIAELLLQPYHFTPDVVGYVLSRIEQHDWLAAQFANLFFELAIANLPQDQKTSADAALAQLYTLLLGSTFSPEAIADLLVLVKDNTSDAMVDAALDLLTNAKILSEPMRNEIVGRLNAKTEQRV